MQPTSALSNSGVEDAPDIGSHRRREKTYFDRNGHIIALKVDLRFALDHRSHEYDVAAGELAKMFPSDAKIHSDGCKLVREGKDVVDNLINVVNGVQASDDPVGWIVQLSGNYGNRENIEKSAQAVLAGLQTLEDRRLSAGPRFGQLPEPTRANKRTGWVRPTYYTPPPGEDFPATFEAERDVSPVPAETTPKEMERPFFEGEPDEFGWVKQKHSNLMVQYKAENIHALIPLRIIPQILPYFYVHISSSLIPLAYDHFMSIFIPIIIPVTAPIAIPISYPHPQSSILIAL
ncbi:hypothetical protein BCR43DRAFT_503980 [Syncephalastrum racemosum]|uniref:Uncharacterized protein n=1 Tax=Syncephalastrum racemosum TaxID=13706 RepID=A0A1X2HJN8_SYNRA|nr:hypothetical protein BCR43DRAFT_503980 [Syncephalastrum racemosum]